MKAILFSMIAGLGLLLAGCASYYPQSGTYQYYGTYGSCCGQYVNTGCCPTCNPCNLGCGSCYSGCGCHVGCHHGCAKAIDLWEDDDP
jgi:hypothetical protein